ncbi:MAG: hypothetical protein ACYSR9_10000, partial [Planctomycetota bacterium]
KVAKHPQIDEIVNTTSDDFKICRMESSETGALSKVVDKSHSSKGKDANFVKHMGGECLHCHSIDLETDAIAIKSGPSNW